MRTTLVIAAFGAAGAVSRHLVDSFVNRHWGDAFPWGTFVINVLGCFLFGLVWTLAEERLVIGGETRAIILIGFMGAFTTFSTFAFESAAMLRDAEWVLAAANVLAHNVVGIAAFFVGVGVGRAF